MTVLNVVNAEHGKDRYILFTVDSNLDRFTDGVLAKIRAEGEYILIDVDADDNGLCQYRVPMSLKTVSLMRLVANYGEVVFTHEESTEIAVYSLDEQLADSLSFALEGVQP